MPKFHKESFFKSFLLFFITIELFLSFIFYNYMKIEEHHLRLNIFLEMKNYSYDFKGDKFDIDFVNKKNQKLYELQEDTGSLFIYTDIKGSDNLLKILYSRYFFDKDINDIKRKLKVEFVLFSLIAFFISILFSFYSLYPLQKAYSILKEFMKDIIHDINTPISAIKLNLTLIDNKDDEIVSIEQSVQTLEMLHKNLDNYLNNTPIKLESYSIKSILDQQISFFQNIYEYLSWDIDIEDEIIYTDKYLFGRVIYNLLNNSCKYNTSNGFIKIVYKNNILSISNSSHGIKNPKKVFQRFYKESDRGLGIGLHIVAKVLKQLHYKYSLDIDKNNIVTIKITIN